MNFKKLFSTSLLAVLCPSIAHASDPAAMMFLFYGVLPAAVLTICCVIETLSTSLLWKLNFWRAVRAFFFANLAALAALAVVSISLSALLVHVETPLIYAVSAPIIGLLIAFKVKFSMSQKSLRCTSKKLAMLYIISHPLALLLLYLPSIYYLEVVNNAYPN